MSGSNWLGFVTRPGAVPGAMFSLCSSHSGSRHCSPSHKPIVGVASK